MKHAYLIMAHNQWEHLTQLIAALDHPNNDIYLHIDKKSALPNNHLLETVQYSNITLTKQFSIVWGGTQMMDCTLNMLQEAFPGHYDYYHFISGTDYPIKSQRYIHQFFSDHQGQQFISFNWAGINSGRYLDRVQYYHFLKNIIGKGEQADPLHRILSKLENRSLSLQKKLHINRVHYQMYKGSSWFSITHEAVAAILKEKQSIAKRYRYTANCDEIWLQTFIMESCFKDSHADTNMRHIKWVQGNPSPETLTTADYDDLIHSQGLFARKFDWNTDKNIVFKLRTHITEE